MKVSRATNGGFSLVEVMISVSILLFVGGSLLNGLLNQQATTKKVTFNSQALSDLSAAAESIAATQFSPCGSDATGTGLNPYLLKVRVPTTVTVSVEGLKTTNNQWYPCGSAQWTSGFARVQRVTLTTRASSRDASSTVSTQSISRSILKFFNDGPESYLDTYKVENKSIIVIQATEVEPNPTLEVNSNASKTCFFTFQDNPYGLFSLTGSDLSCPNQLVIPSSSLLKTYLIDIGAFNIDSGQFAIPGIFTVIVRPPLNLSVTPINSQTSGAYAIEGANTRTIICKNFINSVREQGGTYESQPCEFKVSPLEGTGTGGGFEMASADLANPLYCTDLKMLTSPTPSLTSFPYQCFPALAATSVGIDSSLEIKLSLRDLPFPTTLCQGINTGDLTTDAQLTLNFKGNNETSQIPILIEIQC